MANTARRRRTPNLYPIHRTERRKICVLRPPPPPPPLLSFGEGGGLPSAPLYQGQGQPLRPPPLPPPPLKPPFSSPLLLRATGRPTIPFSLSLSSFLFPGGSGRYLPLFAFLAPKRAQKMPQNGRIPVFSSLSSVPKDLLERGSPPPSLWVWRCDELGSGVCPQTPLTPPLLPPAEREVKE